MGGGARSQGHSFSNLGQRGQQTNWAGTWGEIWRLEKMSSFVFLYLALILIPRIGD